MEREDFGPERRPGHCRQAPVFAGELNATQHLGRRDLGQGCQERGHVLPLLRRGPNLRNEMLSFRIKASYQEEINPKGKESTRVAFQVLCLGLGCVLGPRGAGGEGEGAGVAQGCQTAPVGGRGVEATEARALIRTALSSSLES